MKHGQILTRPEISKRFGGSRIAFAPSRNGRVTCLCIDSMRNPDAPRIVFARGSRGVRQQVERVISQRGPFPTFLKRKPGQWEYLGDYTLTDYSQQAPVIDKHYRQSTTPRNEIETILFFSNSTEVTNNSF